MSLVECRVCSMLLGGGRQRVYLAERVKRGAQKTVCLDTGWTRSLLLFVLMMSCSANDAFASSQCG